MLIGLNPEELCWSGFHHYFAYNPYNKRLEPSWIISPISSNSEEQLHLTLGQFPGMLDYLGWQKVSMSSNWKGKQVLMRSIWCCGWRSADRLHTESNSCFIYVSR